MAFVSSEQYISFASNLVLYDLEDDSSDSRLVLEVDCSNFGHCFVEVVVSGIDRRIVDLNVVESD